MANETFKKLIEINVNSKSINDLKNDIKSINTEIQNIQKNEIKVNQSLEEQYKLLKNIEDLEKKRNELTVQQTKLKSDSLSVTEKQQKKLEDTKKLEEENRKKTLEGYEKQQKKAESLFKVTEGIGGAFQIAEGAGVLFGEKTSEELQKAQTRILSLISLTDGIKKITEGASNGYKLLSESTKKAELASKLFGTTTKAALVSTGIGALVVGIGLLIAYFDDVKKVAKEFADSLGLTKIIEEISIFVDKIGGLTGIFTITKNVVIGLVKEIVNYYKAIGNLLIFDFKALKKNWENAGKEVGKAYQDGVKKAIEDADFERLIKSRENLIKLKENE